MALVTFSASAQIQQAWVARYNNGITNGTNQAVKMALDPQGNIYVTGFSQNANTNLGYVTIKYAPNGTQLWAARYDSTNSSTATPAGFVLDNSNNVIVTGSALTVKYDSSGNEMWTAQFAATSVAVDTNLNVYVVGFSTDFATAKISAAGSNVWQTSYPSSLGPNVSQVVAADSEGNVDVAGSQAFYCNEYSCSQQMLLVQYSSDGNQNWSEAALGYAIPAVQVAGIALDNAGNIYLVANAYLEPYSTFEYASNGSGIWAAFNPTSNGGSVGRAIAVDLFGNTFVTGYDGYNYPNTPFPIGTYKLGTNGAYVWTNLYYSMPVAASVGTAITVDKANNVYVTGYSPGTNFANDIVTIKYGNNGNQIWLQRYTSPGNGNAAGNAIAVDNNGNVYVTGYDTTAAGGTEIVTIKYSPVTLQRRSDGTVILQAQGSPGESFDIEASENLLNWLDLGIATADTNGLMQFDDTNAPNHPARFYYTSPQ
jgi:hypothetical protein